MAAGPVVVIGAGAAGLTAALALSRQGADVVVVDRDNPPPEVDRPHEAFDAWQRPQLPHGRQPHGFLGRSVREYRAHAPDVLDFLAEHGVVPEQGPMAFIPPAERLPGDEEIAWLPTRRLVFELLLRRHVEQQPGVEIRSRTTVRGLSSTPDGPGGRPRLRGVVLDDGTALAADWVVDASGRRGGIGDLLDDIGAGRMPRRSQPCGVSYYTRHYRLLDDATPVWLVTAARADEPHLFYAGFAGDDRTFSILLGPPTWDHDMRGLRDAGCWEAVARSLPAVAPWLAEGRSEPISDVLAMAGNHNVLHEPLVDGLPTAIGYLPIGDALCVTDPVYAWGVSLAVTQVFAAAAALSAHDDPVDVMCAYADSVMPELRACYEESARTDRIRDARSRGVEPEAVTAVDLDRAELFREGLQPGIVGDSILMRAYLRRLNLLEPFDAVWANEDVVRRSREQQQRTRANPPPAAVPPRDELLELVAPALV